MTKLELIKLLADVPDDADMVYYNDGELYYVSHVNYIETYHTVELT